MAFVIAAHHLGCMVIGHDIHYVVGLVLCIVLPGSVCIGSGSHSGGSYRDNNVGCGWVHGI